MMQLYDAAAPGYSSDKAETLMMQDLDIALFTRATFVMLRISLLFITEKEDLYLYLLLQSRGG